MKIKAIDGLPVIDAKRPMSLTVTERDIKGADTKEPADCVVARACRREHHAKEVRVHLARVYVRTNEGNWTRYLTPKPLRSEIMAFDRGGKVEPGTFTLGAPTPTKNLGKRRGGTSKFTNARANPNRKKRAKYHVVTDVRVGPA